MPNYYGQFEPPTDLIIENYFAGYTYTTAIEVGAAQGIAASNTKHFEELGWTCLCIEPNPDMYAQLKACRKHTQNYAVGNHNEDGVIFAEVTLINGDKSALSGLNIDQEMFAAHPVAGVREIKVNLRTLDSCIAEFGKFDKLGFVSIDTEGTELDVLKGFDINKWQPRLIIVENNHDTSEIEDYLKQFHYKKDLRHGVNDFYVIRYTDSND